MSTIKIEGIIRSVACTSLALLQFFFATHCLVSPAGAEKLLIHRKAIINKSFIKKVCLEQLSAFSHQLSALVDRFDLLFSFNSFIQKLFMRDYQHLEIWQRSHKLTLRVYSITQAFPKEEVYGIVSQMRRSASSIPTNIAEGCGRESLIELKRFLTIAAGSSSELQYQFILSKDLNYISEIIFKELFDEISQIRKMIYSYSEKLKAEN
jgi:four helix bundle protein